MPMKGLAMEKQLLFEQIALHLDEVVQRSSREGQALRAEFDELHPADMADFFENLEDADAKKLFLSLQSEQRQNVFKEFSPVRQKHYLSFLDERALRNLLQHLEVDELVDFFEELSDEDLKEYLKLLQEKDREQLVSVLKLQEDAAGRQMEMNVVSLLQDFTVAQSIQILQRLQPEQELHRSIFVTTNKQRLVGYILLEDLVLQNPSTRLASIMRPVDLSVYVDEDQQEVAKKMTRYDVMNVPVVDREHVFLGVISATALVDIIEEETSEDIFRMATMSPIKESYFETPFLSLLYYRSFILILLLFAQTFSSIILRQYEVLLAGFLYYFTTMLASTGGNVSSQTSALVIQGLATGEITDENVWRFIWREMRMAMVLALILAAAAFARVYFAFHYFWGAFAVSLSLGVVVIISVTLGSCIPLILKRFNLDPAHSAGPLLATVMDVVGLFAYCAISRLILS